MGILNWLINKIEVYGIKKCFIFVVAALASISIVIVLWSLEKDVEIEPLVMATSTLSDAREISVIRRGKISDGYSIGSLSHDLISGINSNTEAISSFEELLSASDSAKTKKEKLLIPKGAGYCELGGLGLYTWKKTGKHFLTGVEFAEIHAVYLYEGQYIEASLEANMGFGASVQTGTY